MSLDSLPELVALDSTVGGVRIPPGDTAPLTPRVRALLDTAEMRRLSRVSQLGLVSLVYPGATHTRLEHSLGVYRLAIEFLRRLRDDPRFAAAVGPADAAAFVAAALVHDIGHWPYCHPIEDMGLPEIPRHESLVGDVLAGGAIAEVLQRDWHLAADRIADLITGSAEDPAGRILHSLLSGPVDVDKMDYLARDSLHAGVPYGRNFDQPRLLANLCLDERGVGLAIAAKGRTAAELMVFARYVMFCEVYWHHAVRSATGMLQRAIWIVRSAIDPLTLVRMDDQQFVTWLESAAAGTAAEPLVAGLFGRQRRLFKQVASFDALRRPDLHAAFAARPFAESVAAAGRLADLLSRRGARRVEPHAVLIDAPPAEREVEFRLQVRECDIARGRETACWRRLEDVSPVVRSLAHEQFDDLVKRVRVFVDPDIAADVRGRSDLEELILEAAAPR
ncbi:MAG: HD domain-containing protein [Planctomycetaceae bacterium]